MEKTNKVYILEDYNDGMYYAYKSWLGAYEELMKWYVEDGIDESVAGMMEDLRKHYPTINWEEDTAIKCFITNLKEELTTAIKNGYIESFGYISEAELKE